MKFAVGKQRILFTDGVAGRAISALRISKDSEAANGRSRQGRFVAAVLVTIKWRITAHQGTLKTRKRHLDFANSDGSGTVGRLKFFLIGRDGVEFSNGNFVRLIHLDRVRHGATRLLFQGGSAAVPKLHGRIGGVQNRKRIAGALLAGGSGGNVVSVSKP